MIIRSFRQIVDTVKFKDKYYFKIFNDPFVDENEAAVALEEFEAIFICENGTFKKLY